MDFDSLWLPPQVLICNGQSLLEVATQSQLFQEIKLDLTKFVMELLSPFIVRV